TSVPGTWIQAYTSGFWACRLGKSMGISTGSFAGVSVVSGSGSFSSSGSGSRAASSRIWSYSLPAFFSSRYWRTARPPRITARIRKITPAIRNFFISVFHLFIEGFQDLLIQLAVVYMVFVKAFSLGSFSGKGPGPDILLLCQPSHDLGKLTIADIRHHIIFQCCIQVCDKGRVFSIYLPGFCSIGVQEFLLPLHTHDSALAFSCIPVSDEILHIVRGKLDLASLSPLGIYRLQTVVRNSYGNSSYLFYQQRDPVHTQRAVSLHGNSVEEIGHSLFHQFTAFPASVSVGVGQIN